MTKTYFIDIDGVLFKHNGSLMQQNKSQIQVLENAKIMLSEIEKNGDKIILTTGRKESMRQQTIDLINEYGLFFDELVMGCNRGARIIVNDLKPNQIMKTAFAFCPIRNEISELDVEKILKPQEERPWGCFATLAYSSKYHVKEIRVKPGCMSSLQSHKYRGETWVVIEGSGKAVIGEDTHVLGVNSVCQIQNGDKHRVINDGTEDLVFIEIQTGEQFSENDIVRYEDQFGRVN